MARQQLEVTWQCMGRWVKGQQQTCDWQHDPDGRANAVTQYERHLRDAGHAGYTTTMLPVTP